ncbi:MAG: HAMP domain-containing protein [Nitrosopumilaceae archaeon]
MSSANLLPRKISFGLDKKLIFLVMIVSAITLVTIAVLSFNFAQNTLKEGIENQLIGESKIRGEAVRTLFYTRIKDAQILATTPIVHSLVNELNNLHDDPDFDLKIKEKKRDFFTEVKSFRELVGYSIGLVDVKIIGNDGTVYFSLGRIENPNFSKDPRFIRGLTQPFVELEPTSQGERELVIVTPIFGTEGKEPIGVLIADTSTVELDKILLTRSGLGKTGEVYLVNKDHVMISESRFAKDAAFHQIVNTLPVSTCFERGDSMGGLYNDYRGIPSYGHSYCAKDLGFVLLAEKDESETFEPVLSLQNKIFLAGAVITVVMVILAYFLSKRLSRPLIMLRDAANEIANGNFEIRTNIKRSDEIGQLSSSFDAMAKKIQESLITIRQREDIIKQQQDVLLQFSDQTENYFVCFLDVIGSTKLTANLTDLESSKFYSIFLNSMAIWIGDHGGIVVKNIGDALLFYFPKTNTQDNDAIKDALEGCLKIGELNTHISNKMQQEGLPAFDYRISATYGSVRVAKIATSVIDDIFGSTVNKCAKINRFAPPNGLVIDEALYEIVKSFDLYNYRLITSESGTHEYGAVYEVTRK